MKTLIMIGALFMHGCAANPFDVHHLERIACENGVATPWTLHATRYEDRVKWSTTKYNKDGVIEVLPHVNCVKVIMDKEQLARWKANQAL